MNWTPRFIHVAICLFVGFLASMFSSAHWLAATFWCSATLFLTGSVASVEDSMPGGFDNPDGDLPPLGTWFTIKSIAITLALALAGFFLQSWLGGHTSL